MDSKTSLKCSVSIKKIPDWINEDTRLNVRQVDEREVVDASVMGLSVFRDSINDRKRKKLKSKSKRDEEMQKNFTDLSSTDTEPDYIESESDYDKSLSDRIANKRIGRKNFKAKSKILSEYNSSSSSSSSIDDVEKLYLHFRKLKKLKKNKKIAKCKDLKRLTSLIPVVKKYETKDEMKKRHEQMLQEAKRKYDKVVNKIKEEEEIMKLQISSYEKYKKRQVENCQEQMSTLNSKEEHYYTCPLHFCSSFFISPEEHLIKVHKDDITSIEEKITYLKAFKNVGAIFRKKSI